MDKQTPKIFKVSGYLLDPTADSMQTRSVPSSHMAADTHSIPSISMLSRRK